MTESNFSLIDLKGLSEPASKLIDAVRSAVGILYEPTQIRRKAKAEVDASVVLAEGETKIRDIEIRSNERVRYREIRRQKNIEAITSKAIDSLPDSVSEDLVDQDWIFQFFDNCQDVSDEKMQSLWAKILAGEVTSPNSYSLRTVNIVKLLQQEDANLFTRFCTFLWKYKNNFVAIVYQSKDVLGSIEFDFATLIQLQTLGLIETNIWDGYKLTGDQKYILSYYGKKHLVQVPKEKEHLNIGVVNLSSSGCELAPIAGGIANQSYLSGVVSAWIDQGVKVEEYQEMP